MWLLLRISTPAFNPILRDKGAQAGCIMTGEIDEAKALELAKSFGSMAGKDLAQEVSTGEIFTWTSGQWQLGKGFIEQTQAEFNVVAYDFGVKHNILRMLAERGCKITVVPAKP
ncbi:carbamoyl phosphate synthase small subunit, partial [Pasteurella multocida subsp. multocida str. Anand1_cattle]